MEQKWIGWVEEVNDTSISVRLRDLTNGGTNEKTKISYKDISEEDQKIIKLGSIFHWTINDNDSKINFLKETEEDIKIKSGEISKRFYQSVLNSNLFKDE